MIKTNNILFILCVFFFSCAEEKEIIEKNYSGRLHIPEKNIQVSEEFSYQLKSGDEKFEFQLLIDNGMFTKSFTCISNELCKVSRGELWQAGEFSVTAIAGNKVLDSDSIHIGEDDITYPLDVYVGPQSIVVGGKQEAMLSTIPSDKYDNPITSSDAISFNSTGAQELNEQSEIKNLLSYTRFPSQEKSGQLFIGINRGEETSREQKVLQIPDWPVEFSIEVVKHHPYADNTQYLQLQTSKLKDQHGNQVADGTMVAFYITSGGKLFGIINSMTINGEAIVYIKNPDVKSTWKIQASVDRYIKSNLITLNFKSMLDKIDFTFDRDNDIIHVGPLNSILGQYLPDGTKVKLTDGENIVIQELIEGKTSFIINELEIDREKNLIIETKGLRQKIK